MSYPVDEFTELVTTLALDLPRFQKCRTCRYGDHWFSDSRPGSEESNLKEASLFSPYEPLPTKARHQHKFLSFEECFLSHAAPFPTTLVSILPPF